MEHKTIHLGPEVQRRCVVTADGTIMTEQQFGPNKSRLVPYIIEMQLLDLIERHGLKRKTVGKRLTTSDASYRTREIRHDTLKSCFKTLHELGYQIKLVTNLRDTHIQRLVDYWIALEQKPVTIVNKLSVLRVFSTWIGKPGLVKDNVHYIKDENLRRVEYAATEDKSWSAKAIDKDDLIGAITKEDKYVGMQLRLMGAFGLRDKEAMLFQPYVCVSLDETSIEIHRGTKGGRVRSIPIETEEQRQTIEAAKAMCSHRKDSVIDPEFVAGEDGLIKARNRFYYICRKHGITKRTLGVTAYGLRHQRLNDIYEQVARERSSVRGGDPSNSPNPELIQAAKEKATKIAGHNRTSVTSAYYGKM